MKKQLILLSGGTGVGTSTFSFELAKLLNIPTIISTDWIRESIRTTLNENINPTLAKSTYIAGQTEHYSDKSEEVKKSEIIRAYKNQCNAVNVGVEGVIKRAVNENIPLIIEGVHLIPGKLKELILSEQYDEKVVEYLIHISEPDIHKDRFIQRQKDAPERKLAKYIDNFQEIRWIHDYLVERAERFSGIKLINNRSHIQKGLDQILEFYYSKRD